MKIDEFNYDKINYLKYKKRLHDIILNDELKKYGINKQILGKTHYGYDIDCITIGQGMRELFIVGGIHGSEVIGVDFSLTLMESLPTLSNFDPNTFKLIVIPLQNPEGFDISSNNFRDKSYEYYLRYRTDSIIIYAVRDLNILMNRVKSLDISPMIFVNLLKDFVNNNINWKKLEDERVLPNIKIFNKYINDIGIYNDYKDIQKEILRVCDKTISDLSNDMKDNFLMLFINELRLSFSSDYLWIDISRDNQIKLYQKMFKDASFTGLYNSKLSNDMKMIYDIYKHPKGSQIGHDANGIGVNLNANTLLNPGIKAKKAGKIIYGPGVKNNIKNYFPGPLGTPTDDVNNFSYVIENTVLENLIKKSIGNNNYLATLLYHGTGGLIFYKPYQYLMSDKNYNYFLSYNTDIASIYHDSTGYKMLDNSDFTGYGDYLRRTYPGVLLVELSKGGN